MSLTTAINTKISSIFIHIETVERIFRVERGVDTSTARDEGTRNSGHPTSGRGRGLPEERTNTVHLISGKEKEDPGEGTGVSGVLVLGRETEDSGPHVSVGLIEEQSRSFFSRSLHWSLGTRSFCVSFQCSQARVGEWCGSELKVKIILHTSRFGVYRLEVK